jgi:hypothetical protein
LADNHWWHEGQWIDDEPSADLDRTFEWEQSDYDRIFLHRENRDQIVWWPGVPVDGEVILEFSDAHREPKPGILTDLIATVARIEQLGEQDGALNPLPALHRRLNDDSNPESEPGGALPVAGEWPLRLCAVQSVALLIG